MIVDAHVHFWNFDPVRDSWINNAMEVIRRDFLPEDLEPVLEEYEVSGCVAVQADQSEAETAFLLALAEESPIIKGVVGWIDLKSPDIEERLAGYLNEKKLKGFRHISEGEADGFLIQNDFVKGIKALQKHGYTYDILIKDHQLQEAIGLVDKVPGQVFILDHCAKPAIRTNNLAAWKKDIKIIAQNPNVHCKLSGLLTECNWNDWNEKDIFNCFDIVFDCFGTSRVLYASDWPVMLLAGNYGHWLGLVTKYTDRFAPEAIKMIFSQNTHRSYNL